MVLFHRRNLLLPIYLLVFSILAISCISGSGSKPQKVTFKGIWNAEGFNKISVNNLATFEGFIYAATDSGLYKTDKSITDWTVLGLKEKDVLDVVFLPDNKMLTAVQISNFNNGIPSLFLYTTDDKNWQPYMNNYGGESEVTWIEVLGTPSKPSDTLFAGGGIVYARSLNGGKNWNLLGPRWDLWGGKLNFLTTDPFHKGYIWIGGYDAAFLPFLLKTTDNGDNWTKINTNEPAWDLLSSSRDKKNLLITNKNGIQNSTDGGKTWSTVFQKSAIYTLTHSARTPTTVYASGRNADSTLFFAASGDFGDSWETVEWQDSPAGIQVNDMVSVMEDGQEVLYLGTNKGVYSYRFEE